MPASTSLPPSQKLTFAEALIATASLAVLVPPPTGVPPSNVDRRSAVRGSAPQPGSVKFDEFLFVTGPLVKCVAAFPSLHRPEDLQLGGEGRAALVTEGSGHKLNRFVGGAY